MELRVVGVMMILYAVVSDDVGHRAAVVPEQQRAKHRPLLDSYVDSDGECILMVTDLHELTPAF